MIDLEQMVQVRWNPTTRNHFENLGYVYTHHNDVFNVALKELPNGSGVYIKANCDYCGNEITIPYERYMSSTNNNTIKCACYKCVSFKAFEYGEKRIKLYDEFLDLCQKLRLTPITMFDEFIKRNQKLTFVCQKHGVQTATLDSLRRYKYGCYLCGNEQKGMTAKLTIDQVINECMNHGYILLNPNDYKSVTSKNLRVVCKDCNIDFYTSLSSIRLSNGRCKRCGKKAKLHNTEYVKKQIEKINNNKLLNANEYDGNNVGNLKILCGICGEHEFTTSFGRYKYLNVNRCAYCVNRVSKGEFAVEEILNEFNIGFIAQKRFDDCKDRSTLPFDYYLPDYNKIIEFDGQGHFEPVYGIEKMKSTQKHDAIKNEYCNNNGIDLLRIPYWESNNMRSMIINFLSLYPYKLVIKHYKNPYE